MTPRPPRAAGRRVARPEQRRDRGPEQSFRFDRRLAAATVVVVITFAALLFAGTAPLPTGTHAAISKNATVGRDFSCAGGLPHATATAGHVGAATPQATGLARGPARMSASASQASSAYAFRTASGKGWLAAGACPSPESEWWFVGAGASNTHDGVLTLDNPRDGDAIVDIDVLGPNGVVEAPGLHGVRVVSRGSVQFDLKKYAPAVGDLAVHVTASRGLVAASVAEVWSANFVTRSAHDWVAAQPAAAKRVSLVGLPTTPDHVTLLVANPSAKEAVVAVRFVGDKGTFSPVRHASVTVPPDTVQPVDLDDVLKVAPRAVRLTSQVPITATLRSTRGTDETYASVAEPIGSAAMVGLPAGVVGQLALIGSSVTTRVRVIGYDVAGKQIASRTVTVPADGAASVPLWRRARAVSVLAGPGTGVRGAVLLGRKGARVVANIVLTPTASETRVPRVRQGS